MIIVVKNRNGWDIEFDEIVWDGVYIDIQCNQCMANKIDLCGYRYFERRFHLDKDGEYVFDDGFMYESKERKHLIDIKKEIHLELLYSPDLPFYKERSLTLKFFKPTDDTFVERF